MTTSTHHPSRHRHLRLSSAAAFLAASAALAACSGGGRDVAAESAPEPVDLGAPVAAQSSSTTAAPAPPTTVATVAPTPLAWETVELTSDPGDSFTMDDSDPARLVVSASPSNGGQNSRMILRTDRAEFGDQERCVAFSDGGWPAQPGVALRVATDAAGVTRALTVTKNVWGEAGHFFNVHVWDTSLADPMDRLVQVAALDFSDVVGSGDAEASAPWTLCAAITGDTLTVSVRAGVDPSAPSRSESMMVPLGLPPVGGTGLYAGHVTPDTPIEFRLDAPTI